MKEIVSKVSLAIILSSLKGFENPKEGEEQYITESDIAAELIWIMKMRDELDGKTVADLGAGTGILGIGALLFGAKKVFFVDKDGDALAIAKENIDDLKAKGYILGEVVFVLGDVGMFDEKTNIVLENPPFGTREDHADKKFLEKAFSTANLVYSFHKSSTDKFVRAFSDDNGFKVVEKADYAFPLKQIYAHHKRKIHRIEVSLYRLEKKK